ncbi:uncharacterized protein [Lepeophtheirus salmonis]|uniref:uncharacterized protein isoform X2 n=1 Tax=Lepeophtheirus salmonis TaxID=72036 RepID=UPI001AE71FC2|nr:uncharacterized protein LOC121117305 isoform X2 [Lepeophtheirus salmonis]
MTHSLTLVVAFISSTIVTYQDPPPLVNSSPLQQIRHRAFSSYEAYHASLLASASESVLRDHKQKGGREIGLRTFSQEWKKFRKKKRKNKLSEDRRKRYSEDSSCSLNSSRHDSKHDGIVFELHHPLYSSESYITPKVIYQVHVHFNMNTPVRFFIRSPHLRLSPLNNQSILCKSEDGLGGSSGPKTFLVFETSLEDHISDYVSLELVTYLNEITLSQTLIRRVVQDCELNLSSELKKITFKSQELSQLLINSSVCKIYFPPGSDYTAVLTECYGSPPLSGSFISTGEQQSLILPCGTNTSLPQLSSLEFSPESRFELSLLKGSFNGCPDSNPLIIRNSPARGTLNLLKNCRIVFHPDFGHKVRLQTLTSEDHCPYRNLDGSSISIPTCSFESKDNHVIIETAYSSQLNYEIILDTRISCYLIRGGVKSPDGKHCVKIIDSKASFFEAQKECKRLGGDSFLNADSMKTLTWVHILAQKSYAWKDEYGIWNSPSKSGVSESQSSCNELILVRNSTNGMKYFRRLTAPCAKKNWFICAGKIDSSKYSGVSREQNIDCPIDTVFEYGNEAPIYFGSPNYPQIYPANVNCSFTLRAPPGYGIKIEFERFNLESSEDGVCIYDYLKIGSSWTQCGVFRWKYFEFHQSTLDITFISDYSNEFNGYKAKARALKLSSESVQNPQEIDWREVPFKSDCYNRTLTNMSGEFIISASPSDEECFLIISAPTDHRVILNLPKAFDSLNNCSINPLTLYFSTEETLPWCPSSLVLDNYFLSYKSTLIITYKNLVSTLSNHSTFFSVPSILGSYHLEHFQLQHLHPDIFIFENNVSEIRNVNFPLSPPHNLVLVTKLLTSPGLNIELTVFGNIFQRNENCTDSYLEIEDLYQNSSRSRKFCHIDESSQSVSNGRHKFFKDNSQHRLRSYFNVIILRQVTSRLHNDLRFGILAHGTVDPYLRRKVNQLPPLRSCDDNLCFNGGYCRGFTSSDCVCRGHFVGKHCLETACHNVTCLHGGSCSLTKTGFLCICPTSQFGGRFCEKKLHPCESNPCGGRGICQTKNNAEQFRCQCHLWWTGPRCDRRMKHIPFKPITKRMLEEPFWLGLITVVIVLNILGIGWFIKKHLSDRIERFLFSDEIDSKRSPLVKNIDGFPGSGGSHSHPYDLTPQNSNSSDWLDGPSCSMEASPTLANPLGCSTSGTSKSIFGRLSVRKTSILSFSSNTSSPINGEKKHFSSQEEICCKRSPSPHLKLSNASTESAEEKRLILKKLMTPQSRANSENSFTSLMIKATRSAENIIERANSVSGPSGCGHNSLYQYSMDGFRKDSALSLQIPATVFGGQIASGSGITSVANKKVTFSTVVDQMACSLSGSSSLSDISSLDFDIRRQSSLSKSRKLVRSNRITTSKPPTFCSTKKTRSFPLSYGITSASEDVHESSIESIDSCSPSTLCAVTKEGGVLSINKKPTNHLLKISSADSLISMIRSLTVNRNAVSTPSSPQLSNDGGDWGNEETTNNDTKNPSISSHGSLKLHRDSGSLHQIQVEVVNHQPSDKKDNLVNSAGNISVTASTTSPSNAAQSITLEVPNFQYGQLLSPIKELPSPLPTPIQTPIPSPLPHHRPVVSSRRNSSAGGEGIPMGIRMPNSNTYRRYSSTEEETTFMIPVVPPIVVTSHFDDNDVEEEDSKVLLNDQKELSNNPVIIMTSATSSPPRILKDVHPAIVISSPNSNSEEEIEEDILNKKRPRKFARPLIKQQGVEFPFDSSPRSRSQSIEIKSVENENKNWNQVTIGSPPIKRAAEKSGFLPLDLLGKTPIITITPSNEHDEEKVTNKAPTIHHPPSSSYGLKILNPSLNNNYLSPYSQFSDYGSIRTTSDSNLSSSGYSSMASPSPSRSGSLNPLSENEELHHYGLGHLKNIAVKRANQLSLRKGVSVDSESSETQPLEENDGGKTLQQFIRDRRMSFIRTDSETTDEMFLSESLHTELTNLPLDESISSLNISDIPNTILGGKKENVESAERQSTIPEIEIEPSTPVSSFPSLPTSFEHKIEDDTKKIMDHSSSLQNISAFFKSNNYFGTKKGLNRNCSSTGCLSDNHESHISNVSKYRRLKNEVPQVYSLDSGKSSSSKPRRRYLIGGRRVVSEGKIDLSSSDESIQSNK